MVALVMSFGNEQPSFREREKNGHSSPVGLLHANNLPEAITIIEDYGCPDVLYLENTKEAEDFLEYFLEGVFNGKIHMAENMDLHLYGDEENVKEKPLRDLYNTFFTFKTMYERQRAGIV